MAQNPHFNNYFANNEQSLVHDLMIEAIEIHGLDVKYLKRTPVDIDPILNEPQYEKFNELATVTAYVKNSTSFEGDGQFLQKFGLEIRDQITLTIAVKAFNEDVGSPLSLARPREGDVVYMPVLNAMYQVKFVENASIYFQLGDIQCYDVVCELLEYNNQVFNTGNTTIDEMYSSIDSTEEDFFLVDDSNNAIVTDSGENLIISTYDPSTFNPFADNESIQNESDLIIDWTDIDPFSENGKF